MSALMLSFSWGDATAQTKPPSAQFRAFSIGTLSAVALKDGDLKAPNDGKSFVTGRPPSEVAAVLTSGGAPADHFEFSIQPLLVRGGGRVLLFDTGAGSNFGGVGGELPGSMKAAGIDRASVTDIFISHVHGDHTGGLVTAAGALNFPNATIHISKPEWAYLSGMSAALGARMGLEHVDVLVKTIEPKVAPFEPGAELIPGMVKAVDIKGHTPGHSGYLIGSGENTLLYIGDTLHSYVVSVREPQWLTAFDADPPSAAHSRVELVARVAASGQRLYVVHFPFPGVGKIVNRDGAATWVPESLR
jgi:glyoxylase-like metal-dependent hydrolase (beta-lactamase superfamily II)